MPAKKPPPKKKPADDARAQRQRFIEFAEEHGANDPEALDKAFRDLERQPPKRN